MSDSIPLPPADGAHKRVLTLQRLADQLEKLEKSSHSTRDSRDIIPSGLGPLDGLLPDAGFRTGTLIEWVAERGSADQLALLAARPALGDAPANDRVLIVIDPEETFYPPAAGALGIDLQRLILVRPGKPRRRASQTGGPEKRKTGAEKRRPETASPEILWALEQALQSRGVAVTFCRLERLNAQVFRRLQLSAERGGGLGFLIRPPTARGEPSWSDVRLGIEAMNQGDSSSARQWRLEILRCRRGAAGDRSVLLEYDDATNTVRSAPRMVPIAPSRRARA